MKMEKETLWQVIKFTLFSISAGLIQIATFEIMYDLIHINYWVSYLVSLVLSVLWNFTFNRKYTFQASNNIPLSMLLVAIYYAVFTPLSTLWGHALEKIGVPGFWVTAISMIINFVTEFLYQKFVVFRKSNKTVGDIAFEKMLKVVKTPL